MIAEYEADEPDPLYAAPRQYALTQQHKHLREMCAVPGLTHAPVFAPIVADFYSGMETSVALFGAQLCPGKTLADIKAAYAAVVFGAHVCRLKLLNLLFQFVFVCEVVVFQVAF